MNILTIGDVVSTAGCEYLRRVLPNLKKEYRVDVCVANGENSAMGNGILPASADFLLDSGVDVLTGGNHTLRRREFYDYLDSQAPAIRPANLHKSAPGSGLFILDKGNVQVGVINLQGTVFMDNIENPFDCLDRMIKAAREAGCRVILVDFHAEATAEKRALGFYADGRISALFGTHTHVQTADEQILQEGTGYITDLGMTGAIESVLGVTPALAIERMRTNLPVHFKNPDGPCSLSGCLFHVNPKTGKTEQIERIFRSEAELIPR